MANGILAELKDSCCGSRGMQLDFIVLGQHNQVRDQPMAITCKQWKHSFLVASDIPLLILVLLMHLLVNDLVVCDHTVVKI